jgi:hypothetical protein
MNQKLISYLPPPPDTSRAPQCGPRMCDNVVARLVWGDAFGGILRDLAADSGFRSAIATIRRLTKPACWDAAAAWGSSDPACPVDSFFVRFVNEPEPVLDYAFRWELRRLTEIETRQMTTSKTASRIGTLAEMTYTAQAFPYRSSFFAPSTVPDIEPSHLGWNLIPYYATAGIAGRRGFELGWDFVLKYWRDAHIGITAPVSFFHRPPPDLDWFAFQVAVQFPRLLSSGSRRNARSLSTELAWSPPGMSKLKLAYRTDGTMSIGLADLPGILYWGWRFF